MLRYPRTPFLHPPFIAPLISPGDLSLSIPSLPITVVLPRSRPRSRRPRAAALVITPATILILALVLTIFGLIIPIAPIAVVAVALTSPLLSSLSLALCSPYDVPAPHVILALVPDGPDLVRVLIVRFSRLPEYRQP